MRIMLEDLNNGGAILVFTSDEGAIDVEVYEEGAGAPTPGKSKPNIDHQQKKGWYYARIVGDFDGGPVEYPSGPFQEIGAAVRDAVACNWADSKELNEWLQVHSTL